MFLSYCSLHFIRPLNELFGANYSGDCKRSKPYSAADRIMMAKLELKYSSGVEPADFQPKQVSASRNKSHCAAHDQPAFSAITMPVGNATGLRSDECQHRR